MDFKCTLEFEYADDATAQRVLASVEVDNEGYIDAWTEGRRLLASARSDDLRRLVQTLDDFLACAAIAEGTVQETAGIGTPL